MDIELYKHIKNSGMVEYKIKQLTQYPIFDDLSKHNTYWDSEHEIEADRLEEIRLQFCVISADLQEILNILDEADRRSFL